MSGRIGLQYPGAFEGGSGALSEIDRALAVIGAAHWTEKYRPSPTIGHKAPRSIGRFGGQIERFPPPRLNGRCQIRKRPVAVDDRRPGLLRQALRERLMIRRHQPLCGAVTLIVMLCIVAAAYFSRWDVAATLFVGGLAAAGVSVNEVLHKQAPAIPESAELALAELKKAAEMPGDAGLRRVRVERAQQAVGVEMIKAT
jgi:hypothetical protein